MDIEYIVLDLKQHLFYLLQSLSKRLLKLILVFSLWIFIGVIAKFLIVIVLNFIKVTYRFVQTISVFIFSLKIISLSWVSSVSRDRAFLLLLLRALLLVSLAPFLFFFFSSFIEGLSPLFDLKVVRIVGRSSFKLSFFALFFLEFLAGLIYID